MRSVVALIAFLAGCSSPVEASAPPVPVECPVGRVCGDGWSYVPNDSEVSVEPSTMADGQPSSTIPAHESRWQTVDEGGRYVYSWAIDCGFKLVCRNSQRGMYGCVEVARTFEC